MKSTPSPRTSAGAHLTLSLERLAALCGDELLRIGLSATQNPVSTVAHFLVGAASDGLPANEAAIIDTGHHRPRDLGLEMPDSPLEAVMSGEVWTQVYGRLARLIEEHRTTLVFVNTRRMAERIARELSERLGESAVTAHHGSMAKEKRLMAEQRLKRGELKALVATASLELGIDIGDVDLVCQLGSPRSIAAFLQRVGRSGHAIGGTPKGRLFPLSRDDLVESAALLDSVRRGELDRLAIPDRPLDVLAQQIVAEVAAQDWPEGALYERLRRAWPFRNLKREDFDAVVRMLAEGFATRQGRRAALIHRDAVNGVLRGRRGARMTALTSGGTIPDTADYQVVLEPENHVIGTVNEDFAVESMQGDVFQLGNASYRIQRVERGTVRVEDAHGQPPTIPFWLGEAPGRTDELSLSVSRLRADLVANLRSDPSGEAARRWLAEDVSIGAPAARQLVEYLGAAAAALGCLPTQETIVLERFFDEAGGMQLVVHSPFGSRINRAWGLALRKRFCRKFNFELQAAATEDNIVLSLTTAHSFELGDVARYLHSASVRPILIQAMLDAPMFTTRWRWVAGVSLALPRFRSGKKVPPQFLRMQAEDLIAAVFPDQIACAENLAGEREVPDHPLTNQAIFDCLHEAMDIEGLERLLARLEAGDIRIVSCDLTQPSPLALEALSARPYAYLDDAPLEERRTQAVMARRWQDPQSASELGRLDPEAIERVRSEAWPDPENAEELHDALLWLGCLTETETRTMPAWSSWLAALAGEKRVARLKMGQSTLWIPAERLTQFQALWPKAELQPEIAPPADQAPTEWAEGEALVEILRGRLEGLGPVTQTALTAPLGLEPAAATGALAALEAEGAILRGRFIPGANDEQWCDRRLLARIHRYTIRRLRSRDRPRRRARFSPLPVRLAACGRRDASGGAGGAPCRSGSDGRVRGARAGVGNRDSARPPQGLRVVLARRPMSRRTVGLGAPYAAGRRGRSRVPRVGGGRYSDRPAGAEDAGLWMSLAPANGAAGPSPRAQVVLDCLLAQGALFFDELVAGRPPVAVGGRGSARRTGGARARDLRQLRWTARPAGAVGPAKASCRRETAGPGSAFRHRERRPLGDRSAGNQSGAAGPADEAVEHAALTLLRRYGVVFWRLLAREAGWLPPWRDLLRVYRRLEARGEIRGGRFVAGFSGEQYALPEAVGLMREIRRRPASGQWVSLSGADPLNLVGVLTPGPRLAALAANRLVFRDGLPVAALSGGKTQFLADCGDSDQWEAEKRLVRSSARGLLAELA